MHFDIEARDITGAAARLITLGATEQGSGRCQEHGANRIVIADPEGNEFCVCDAGQGTTTAGNSP